MSLDLDLDIAYADRRLQAARDALDQAKQEEQAIIKEMKTNEPANIIKNMEFKIWQANLDIERAEHEIAHARRVLAQSQEILIHCRAAIAAAKEMPTASIPSPPVRPDTSVYSLDLEVKKFQAYSQSLKLLQTVNTESLLLKGVAANGESNYAATKARNIELGAIVLLNDRFSAQEAMLWRNNPNPACKIITHILRQHNNRRDLYRADHYTYELSYDSRQPRHFLTLTLPPNLTLPRPPAGLIEGVDHGHSKHFSFLAAMPSNIVVRSDTELIVSPEDEAVLVAQGVQLNGADYRDCVELNEIIPEAVDILTTTSVWQTYLDRLQ